MEYEFLKQFARRMKSVGMYAVLAKNSFQKTTWKQYGFLSMDEQMNVMFAVLLYIMEQSLRDEVCTMDDIGIYLDHLNMGCWKKELSYEMCKSLGEFIVNVVLCDEGRAMYFDGYDFERKSYHSMHVSFVANRIVYIDKDVKRTSYYLTEDGYNLLLSTLEIENNLKLTIQEMIFKLHLEKASYDKALDDMKKIFDLLRMQLQKMKEAMKKIRQNALSYSVADYKKILVENLETMSETKAKYQNYEVIVKARAGELEEVHINIRKLDRKEEEMLQNLRSIEHYLSRVIDEHQQILNVHFDLKSLYTKELEELSHMSLIRRYSLRQKLYEKVLSKPEALTKIHTFFRPLFMNLPDKTYNLNQCLELQKPVRPNRKEEEEEILDFEEEAYLKEQEQALREKVRLCQGALKVIFQSMDPTGCVSLGELASLTGPARDALLPGVEIFKEVVVELLRGKSIDIKALRKEQSEFPEESVRAFRFHEVLLDLLEHEGWEDIAKIEAFRLNGDEVVVFQGVKDDRGRMRTIRCSNVAFYLVREEDGDGLDEGGDLRVPEDAEKLSAKRNDKKMKTGGMG